MGNTFGPKGLAIGSSLHVSALAGTFVTRDLAIIAIKTRRASAA
jgi:hypothetical protein